MFRALLLATFIPFSVLSSAALGGIATLAYFDHQGYTINYSKLRCPDPTLHLIAPHSSQLLQPTPAPTPRGSHSA